ncbi:MAG: hypothetical protein JST36_10470 [Bacteroidetes bacterium]|nr:hypothetical protein [Bacteroidota bacterium]
MKQPLWRILWSYVKPFEIRRASSHYNPRLELLFYEGAYILSTGDALYSEGRKYRPVLAALKSNRLRAQNISFRSVLLLGTGLASAAHIISHSGKDPSITLVEIDQQILDWAMEFLPDKIQKKARPICHDAFQFMATNSEHFDLIFVDLFFGLVTASKVFSLDFLESCKRSIGATGTIVLNAIFPDAPEADRAKALLAKQFNGMEEIRFGKNRVFVLWN